MMLECLESLRNLYSATGGTVPGPAWTAALATLFWIFSHEDAGARHRRSHECADPEGLDEAFKLALARGLGWTDPQLEEFWNDPEHDFNADGTPRYDMSRDAWEDMLKRIPAP